MTATGTIPPPRRRDLPLDSHLHTDLSPDSDVPIDAYAAQAVERGIAEIAITDHVDFDPGRPAFEFVPFDDPRARSSARPPSAGARAASRSGSAWRSPTTRATRPRSAITSRATPTTSSSAASTSTPIRRTTRSRVAAWVAGRSLAEIVAPYFDEVAARDPVRAVRHDRPPRLRQALPPSRTSRRPTSPRPRSCTSRCSRPSSRPGRRSRSTRAACARPPRETYPSAAVVARYRGARRHRRFGWIRCP